MIILTLWTLIIKIAIKNNLILISYKMIFKILKKVNHIVQPKISITFKK